MHYKSLYPPLPRIPGCNVHDFIFASDALKSSEDKVLFIDPLAAKSWRKHEFKERVYDCATALVTPVSEGGLGFAPEGEMVGIMSTNCLVSKVNSLARRRAAGRHLEAGGREYKLPSLSPCSASPGLLLACPEQSHASGMLLMSMAQDGHERD